MKVHAAVLAAIAAWGLPAPAPAQEPDYAVASVEDARAYNAEGDPTFDIAADGTVDWPTFSGFRRYHSECHVCHGPDGEGSSYAPGLREAVKRLPYPDFVSIVAVGVVKVDAAQNQVMPAFGENLNVMCYLEDIYVYLRARAAGAAPRGRPAKRADKPPEIAEQESECMGG